MALVIIDYQCFTAIYLAPGTSLTFFYGVAGACSRKRGWANLREIPSVRLDSAHFVRALGVTRSATFNHLRSRIPKKLCE
jgi:hypothetical protein